MKNSSDAPKSKVSVPIKAPKSEEELKEYYLKLKRKKFIEGYFTPCRLDHIKSKGNGL